MDENSIKALLLKYQKGLADSQEIMLIEQLIEEGTIDLAQFEDLEILHGKLVMEIDRAPSMELDHRFYQMLAGEKKKLKGSGWWDNVSWNVWLPRLSAGMLLFCLGLLAGQLMKEPSSDADALKALRLELSDMRETMMLALLHKESVTERLKAVSLTDQMETASTKVTAALLQALNEDDNVNVRLAALEALKPYTSDSRIRHQLILSIARQDAPLVQVALAELMAELLEKSSVKELNKIIDNKNTPDEIRKKIKETIHPII
jgi:hypothetical protein